MKDPRRARRIFGTMIDFDFENDRDVQPGLWPKLITLAGLAAFWGWVLYLIF